LDRCFDRQPGILIQEKGYVITSETGLGFTDIFCTGGWIDHLPVILKQNRAAEKRFLWEELMVNSS